MENYNQTLPISSPQNSRKIWGTERLYKAQLFLVNAIISLGRNNDLLSLRQSTWRVVKMVTFKFVVLITLMLRTGSMY